MKKPSTTPGRASPSPRTRRSRRGHRAACGSRRPPRHASSTISGCTRSSRTPGGRRRTTTSSSRPIPDRSAHLAGAARASATSTCNEALKHYAQRGRETGAGPQPTKGKRFRSRGTLAERSPRPWAVETRTVRASPTTTVALRPSDSALLRRYASRTTQAPPNNWWARSARQPDDEVTERHAAHVLSSHCGGRPGLPRVTC